MKIRIPLAATLCFILCTFALHGQAPAMPYAEIVFIQGDDLDVIRSNRPLSIPDPIGFRLQDGDQVQTGKRSFVEIRFYPKGSLLKLSENTTFAIKEMKATGETTLVLLYGRIRAKVEKLAGAEAFSVQSSQAVAGVRGTDFGYDLLALTASSGGQALGEGVEPVASVYCFEGSVEVVGVIPAYDGSGGALERIAPRTIIEAGSMAVMRKEGDSYAIDKEGLNPEIQQFWKANDFKTPPPGVAPGSAGQSPLPPPPPPGGGQETPPPDAQGAPESGSSSAAPGAVTIYRVPALKAQRSAIAAKSGATLAAFAFSLISVGFECAGAYYGLYGGDMDLSRQLNTIGAISGIVSLPVLIYAVAIDTSLPPEGSVE